MRTTKNDLSFNKENDTFKKQNAALLEAAISVRNEYRSYVLNDPKNLEDAKGSRILAQIDRAIAQAEAKP